MAPWEGQIPKCVPGVDALGARGVKGSSCRDIFGNSGRPRVWVQLSQQRYMDNLAEVKNRHHWALNSPSSPPSRRIQLIPSEKPSLHAVGILAVLLGEGQLTSQQSDDLQRGNILPYFMRGAGATCTASHGLLWNTGNVQKSRNSELPVPPEASESLRCCWFCWWLEEEAESPRCHL